MPLCTIYAANNKAVSQVEKQILGAYHLGDEPMPPLPILYARVTKAGVEKLG